MRDGLPRNSSFLVREHESRVRDRSGSVSSFKSGYDAEEDRPIHRVVDVTKAEGLGTGFAGTIEVFGRAEEPEESNNQEIKDMDVGGSVDWVMGVKDFGGGTEDGEVCWIGARGRGVLVPEGAEEINE